MGTETSILLESGTNELEILEFKVGNNHYGINVAKIREILICQPATPIPNSHPCIEGIFMPREDIITIINLQKCLGIEEVEHDTRTDMYIVTNFNKLNTAFHVHSVLGIHRVSWSDIVKPDSTMNAEEASVATGIVRIDGRLVLILDFESIVSNINPESSLKLSDVEHMKGRGRNDIPIQVAEDSALLSKMILNCLHEAGYSNITVSPNGLECWEKIKKFKSEGTLKENVACVVTDIEMPQMDGHRLTKLIREDAELNDIPIIIFSSLINDEMRRKGEKLGANAQLSKPEIGLLVEEMDRLLEIGDES